MSRRAGAVRLKPASTVRRRPDTTFRMIAIAVVALALRLAHLAYLRRTPLFSVLIGDALQYDTWARQIASGQWVGSEVFYQTPLYPYLLAIVFKIAGHHLLLVRGIQAVLGATSCVLLAWAGRRFFSEPAGLAAGALLAIYPPAIFFDGLIQKSSLDLFLMTLLLALLGEFLARPRWALIAGAGVVLAAFTLNRENARVLYPIIVVWLFVYFQVRLKPDPAGVPPSGVPMKTRAAWVGIFTAAVAALLIPVGVRNYYVSGDFLISTSQAGSNFYIGNHTGAHGGYQELVPDHGNAAFERDDAKKLAEEGAGRTLSPGDVSDYWLARAAADIRRNPVAWVTLLGRKLLLTLNTVEAVDTESIETYADYSPVLRALMWFTFGIVMPMAALGVWLTRRDWRRLAILYAMFISLVLSVAVFYLLARYRFPIVPITMLFAGSALSLAIRNPRSTIRNYAGVALAGAVAIAVNVPMRTSYDETRLNVGSELIRAGRPAEAIPLLEQAAASSTDYALPHFDLGLALDATGQTDRAIDEFGAAIHIRPDFADAQENLAIALWRADRRQDAIQHYQEAVRLKPDDPVAENNLATALLQEQRVREAIPHYEAALRVRPEYAEAHSNLALAYQALGNVPAALQHFADAARLRPDNYGMHLNFGNMLIRLGRTSDAIDQYERALPLAQAAGQADLVEQITAALREWRARPPAARR
jgi:tetratricopeptide (TPR) repeat protein